MSRRGFLRRTFLSSIRRPSHCLGTMGDHFDVPTGCVKLETLGGKLRLRSKVSVPKILTLFIPEILSHPAKAGKDRTLPMPPVGGPGRREEDVRNVKASRSRDSVEGWSPQDRSGSFGGSFPVFGEAHCGRNSGCACR